MYTKIPPRIVFISNAIYPPRGSYPISEVLLSLLTFFVYDGCTNKNLLRGFLDLDVQPTMVPNFQNVSYDYPVSKP